MREWVMKKLKSCLVLFVFLLLPGFALAQQHCGRQVNVTGSLKPEALINGVWSSLPVSRLALDFGIARNCTSILTGGAEIPSGLKATVNGNAIEVTIRRSNVTFFMINEAGRKIGAGMVLDILFDPASTARRRCRIKVGFVTLNGAKDFVQADGQRFPKRNVRIRDEDIACTLQ